MKKYPVELHYVCQSGIYRVRMFETFHAAELIAQMLKTDQYEIISL